MGNLNNKVRITCSWSNAADNPIFQRLISIIAGCLIFGGASADIGIRGSVVYDENPLGIAENTNNESDLRKELSVDANFARETERFRMSLNYQATKTESNDYSILDRTFTQGRGQLEWRIIPDVLSWDFSNTRSDQLINSFLPDNSGNRQVISVYATGPSLILPIGAANQLSAQVEFSTTDYSQTDIDRDAASANISFSRRLSGTVSAAINTSYTEIEYPSGLSIFDYDTSSASFEISRSTENLRLFAEIGETSINQVGLDDTSNPLMNLSASYDITPNSGITISFNQSTRDYTSEAIYYLEASEIDFQSDFETILDLSNSARNSIYSNEALLFGYSFNAPSRYSVNVNYSVSENDGLRDDFVEDIESLELRVSVPLSPRLSVGFRAWKSELKATDIGDTRDFTMYQLNSNYRYNDSFSVSAFLTDRDQSSRSGGFTYDSLSAGVSASFRF